ncbi:MAG TPA: MraZ N-terminal domain-containing protein [Candidatus Paceibacterota bacterium]|nr:MraZ N-terminal domain-containing protein [Candidatus Paceibacterota bacterium]
MLKGSKYAVVDDKWRLMLPAKFSADFGKSHDSVIIASAGNGCLNIYPYPAGVDRLSGSSEVSLRRSEKKKCVRITIPEWMRSSVSFFYGRTVTVAGKRDHIELQPRPPWCQEEKRKVGRPSSIH